MVSSHICSFNGWVGFVSGVHYASHFSCTAQNKGETKLNETAGYRMFLEKKKKKNQVAPELNMSKLRAFVGNRTTRRIGEDSSPASCFSTVSFPVFSFST